MKVFVLGGTGFVGGHVARAFAAAGHEVAVGVRPGSSREGLAGLTVEEVPVDLEEPASLLAALRGREVVVHAAGVLSLWERHGQRLYDVNVIGTRNVVDACLAAGVRRLIYTGSVGVYAGTTTPTPVDERGAPTIERFHSFHVTSMCLAEAEVFKGAARGLEVVALHPSLCLGEGDRNFHSSWAMVGLAFVRLQFVPPGGLNLVDVTDVARSHVAAAERGRAGEAYLLGGENLTNQAYAELLADVLGLPPLRVPLTRGGIRALGRVSERLAGVLGVDRGAYITLNRAMSEAMSLYWFLDDRKAQRELGHSHSPIRRALERQVAWLRERGYLREGYGLRDFAHDFLGGRGQ